MQQINTLCDNCEQTIESQNTDHITVNYTAAFSEEVVPRPDPNVPPRIVQSDQLDYCSWDCYAKHAKKVADAGHVARAEAKADETVTAPSYNPGIPPIDAGNGAETPPQEG